MTEDIIEDPLGARLMVEPLPLDRFAQSEMVNGRAIITVNSRISEMPKVKDVQGFSYVAQWHEVEHVDRDLGEAPDKAGTQMAFANFETGRAPA